MSEKITYDILEELGKVGQRKYDGLFFEEFEKRLEGKKGVEVYKEMSLNDEIIGAILFSIEMLIKQSDFYIEAGGDTPKDEEARTFIEECLDDLNPGWDTTLTEILSFLTYGWHISEICYKRRLGETEDNCSTSKYTDGLIGWSKFAARAQDTLYKWVYNEHDDLVAFSQIIPGEFEVRTIPIDKCLHFKTRSQKENPEGQSILRTAYRAYYFKSRIQVIEGIGIERDLVGLPVLYTPENTDIYSEVDPRNAGRRKWAQSVISNIRRDEQEGVLLPYGWEIKLLESGGSRQFDVGAVIERYDRKIAGSVLADFITLGHEGVGSYALSQNKTSTFFLAISAYLDTIADVINNQAIPRLIKLNGEHFKGITGYPKLIHTNVEKRDLTALSDYVSKLVSIGAMDVDEELQKYLRQEADLPMMITTDDMESLEVEDDTYEEHIEVEES